MDRFQKFYEETIAETAVVETYRFEFYVVILNLGYYWFNFVVFVNVSVLKLQRIILRLFNSGSSELLSYARIDFLVVLDGVFEVHFKRCHGTHTTFEFFHLFVVCKL